MLTSHAERPCSYITVALLCVLLAGGEVTGGVIAQASARDVSGQLNPAGELPDDVFAVVGDQVVSMGEFREYMASSIRQRFYHGKVSHEQMAQAHDEIAHDLINNVLLLQEAERRNIAYDEHVIAEQLKKYQSQRAMSLLPPQELAATLSALKSQLRQTLRLKLLRTQIGEVKGPVLSELHQYYDENPAKFTMPGRSKLSLILLKVPPYEPSEAWQHAMKQAQELHKQLISGADFAQLARDNSDHESASSDGDLGVVHNGMLSLQLERVVNGLQPHQISAPVAVLQGVVLVRLDERYPSALTKFEKVKDRVRDLMIRERQETAWQELIDNLRATTSVKLSAQAM